MLHLSLKNMAAYGEMGTVDASNCLCFVGFAVSSLMEDGDSKCTGCGCETDKVNGIVKELKRRQAFRGDRAKVRMGEATLESLEQLNTKVRSIVLRHSPSLFLDYIRQTPPLLCASVLCTLLLG